MSISVKNITVTIGGSESTRFDIKIGDTKWRLDNFTLYQSLMTHNTLTFDLHKGPEETSDEPRFFLCSQLIGKPITLDLETDNIEDLSLKTNNQNTARISFDGVIFSASGSRVGTQYSIQVEARSWDALLDDNPNCKSFEELTLNDIVNDVIGDYSQHLTSIVDARFTDIIAYCVQYNETNYQFLQRLAQRYGEWLYNDGKQLVFGNLKKDEDTVKLKYPSNDVPSYGIDMMMQHVEFKHVTSSYNAYASTQKDGLSEMSRHYNDLSDSVFEASKDNFTKPTLQNLHSGGFADDDGRETLLNVSTKAQGRGEKARMLTYSGTTYCSKLKIGAVMTIVDGHSNNDNGIAQDEILITELTHNFSADEVYSNSFVGIPSVCDYPPYSNSDVYPYATSPG